MIKYLIFEEDKTSIYLMYKKVVVNESFFKTTNDILRHYLIDLTSYNKNYKRKYLNAYLIPIYIKPNLCLMPINGIKSGGPLINFFAVKDFEFLNNKLHITWKDHEVTKFNIKKDKWDTLLKRAKTVIDLYL